MGIPDVTYLEQEEDQFSYEVKIYTDGSKNLVGTGAGFVVMIGEEVYAEESIPLGSQCSNYQAEIYAICKALVFVLETRRLSECSSFLILTDSMSAIAAINSLWNENPLIQLIKRLVKALQDRETLIHIKWIKGHSGIPGNELDDDAARKGANLNLEHFERPFYNFIPVAEMKLFLDRFLWFRWLLYAHRADKPFNRSPLNSWLRTILPFPNDFTVIGGYKKIVNSIDYYTTQFLNGHGAFSSYLHKRCIRENDSCLVCGFPGDDPQHILFQCAETGMLWTNLERIQIYRNSPHSIFKCLIRNDEGSEEFRKICKDLIKQKIASSEDDLPP